MQDILEKIDAPNILQEQICKNIKNPPIHYKNPQQEAASH
jgi:hypothetical protein